MQYRTKWMVSKCKGKQGLQGFSHMECHVRFHDVFGNLIDGFMQTNASVIKSREHSDSRSYSRSRKDWWRHKNAGGTANA